MTPQPTDGHWETRRVQVRFVPTPLTPAFQPLSAYQSAPPSVARNPKLLDQVRETIRTRHYSLRTEKAYVQWIKRFIFFHDKRHPREMGAAEISRFLSALAVEGRVSASTQNQALSALLFLYRDVLSQEVSGLQEVVRAKRPQRLPVVLSRMEIRVLLTHLQGEKWLLATLLYGTGLRLMECLRLRVKDIDLDHNQIVVREGKGDKDRLTMLPATVKDALIGHLGKVRAQHERDLKRGLGQVFLPNALERKYSNANREWGWQWVFPATQISTDPRSGVQRRHHLHESVLHRAIKEATHQAGIAKPGQLPHLEAFLCHASLGRRLRHPHRARTAGACRCQHHDDLHPCVEPWRARRVQSGGSTVRRTRRKLQDNMGDFWRVILHVAADNVECLLSHR